MHKFWATNGEDLFLPGVSFHLPTANICLMSSQSYHQQWGGYSLVEKERVLMNLWHPDGKPSHVLKFQLDEHSNTPTAVNFSCMAEEQETLGPIFGHFALGIHWHPICMIRPQCLSVNTILTWMHLSFHRWQIHQMSIWHLGRRSCSCGIGDWELACHASKSLWFLIGHRMKMSCKT